MKKLLKLKDFLYDEKILPFAAQISFYIMLTLIPMFSLLILIINLITRNNPDEFVNFIFLSFPTSIANTLTNLLTQISKNVGFGIFNIIAFLWFSTKAMDNLIRVINKIEKIPFERNFIKKKLKSVYLVFVLLLTVVGSFVLLFFRDVFFIFLENFFPTKALYSFSNYVLSIAIILLGISLFYDVAKERRDKYIRSIPGGIFFAISWVILASVFTWYTSFMTVSVMANISIFFVLMLFVYIGVILLLYGAKINYLLQNVFK